MPSSGRDTFPLEHFRGHRCLQTGVLSMNKAIIVAFLFTASCGPKTQVQAPAPIPSGPPEHEVLYRAGLEAFRLATPEGYRRAADSFRRAAKLNVSNCEYSIRLADALVFLAQEQKLNLEDFG